MPYHCFSVVELFKTTKTFDEFNHVYNLIGKFDSNSKIKQTTLKYEFDKSIYNNLEYIAKKYKKYEHIRHDKIQEQVSQGILDVVLPPPYATPPKDKLGLIAADSLKDNHKDWPNYLVPSIFGAKSIIQQKLNPSN